MQIYILYYIIFIALALWILRNFIFYFYRKTKLGQPIKTEKGTLKKSDFTAQVIIFLAFAIILYFRFRNEVMCVQQLILIYCFAGAFILYFAYSSLMVFSTKGLYENGIATLNGIVFWKEIKEYEWSKKLSKKPIALLRINQSSSMIKSGKILMVDGQNQEVYEEIVKIYTAKYSKEKKDYKKK